MTTEPNTNPTPETPAPAEAAVPAADRMRYVIPAVLSTLLTLVALAPVAYVINRNMPARVATVDLQVLVEEDQFHFQKHDRLLQGLYENIDYWLVDVGLLEKPEVDLHGDLERSLAQTDREQLEVVGVLQRELYL